VLRYCLSSASTRLGLPSKTTYTIIAEMLAGIDQRLRDVAEGADKEGYITWAVDATGVSDGVCEIIQKNAI
jgi:hypothetical protein